jgi:DNA-binding CsgD family transcriptional regulator
VAGEWPLVGRELELGLIGGLLRSPERNGAVLAGPAGVGKTRLALECMADATRAGLPTAQVAVTRSTSHLPFEALAPLLPAAKGAAPGEQGEAAFLRRCCRALAERGGGQRLVLFIDDAQFLDVASATLTHQLAETGSAFVLATIRLGGFVPDPVTALWKDGNACRVDIEGLGPSAIADLLVAALGGPVETVTVARLRDCCRGNILFLRELVLGARASGALICDDGRWRLVGPLMPSDRLIELVETRLGNLDDAERGLLELVALGEPLGMAEIGARGSLTVAESLERHGLLQSRVDGRRLELRLAHPVYGEVLRVRTPAVRLRAVNRALADALEATGARRRGDVLRLATWRLEGGGGVSAPAMLTAARQARAFHDFALSERLARAAVEAGAGFKANLLVGQLLSATGRAPEAERHFAAMTTQNLEDGEQARLAVHRVDNLCHGLGSLNEALTVAEKAEAGVTEDTWRDALAAKRIGVLNLQGETAAAVALADDLLPRVTGRAVVPASVAAANAYGIAGRLSDAVAAAGLGIAAIRVVTGTSTPWNESGHIATRELARLYAGELTGVEAIGLEWYERALDEHWAEPLCWFSTGLCGVNLAQGKLGCAVRWGREAVTLNRQQGRVIFLRWALSWLAHALAIGGHADDAAATLRELSALPTVHALETEADRARAWTAVAGGDLPGARELLTNAAAAEARRGGAVLECAALHDLARLGDAATVAPRLSELATVIDGPLALARATHAVALAASDPAGLEAASQSFEVLGAVLFAAEAAADAAVAWRRAADHRRAASAERRAGALAGRCEGAATPALGAVQSPVVLSQAERDVALLAAAGRSNKEIAEQLYLSLRTVENYLHRAYEKLGVSGRAELAQALQG